MKWHLLNQLYVNLGPTNLEACVLEEVVSSDLQLVQLLASVMALVRTMTSQDHGHLCYNQIDLKQEYLT